MNPKDFHKLVVSHAGNAQLIHKDWIDYLTNLSMRIYRKSYDGYIHYGNTYYKKGLDKDGNPTIVCSTILDDEFYPVYDEDSHARWKYESLSDYQASVERWMRILYEDVIKLPGYCFRPNPRYSASQGRWVQVYDSPEK